MPGTIPRCMPAEITRKGRELAMRRRAHLVELYDTGRWRRYYTEEQLVARMRESIALVETWDRLVGRPDTPHAIAAE
jgi:uncharacterized repeat protein (TIGR03809 family)